MLSEGTRTLKTLLLKGPVEKWKGSDKNPRNCPKIKWPIYIINHWKV